jgi:hypothetical protein
VNAGSREVRIEAQGPGTTENDVSSLAALGALSVAAVTGHGEPVGTPSAAELLHAALVALRRDSDLATELALTIECLVRQALRALGEGDGVP